MRTNKCISDTDFGRLLCSDVTGEYKKSLLQHIDVCPECKSRWDQACSGAAHLDKLFSKTGSQCPDKDTLAGLMGDTLSAKHKLAVQTHIANCQRCSDILESMISESYARESNTWWSEYVGSQILALLGKVPEEIDSLLTSLGISKDQSQTSQNIIKLSFMEPVESVSRRLAADTGEGLLQQKIHQDNPPFDFHLIRFGDQIRISIQASPEDKEYHHCLGKLDVTEGDSLAYSQVILIEKGRGQCIIEPTQAKALLSRKAPVGMRFEPVVTLLKLASLGPDAYMPMLRSLLQHEDPQIRRATVQVVSRIYGSQARPVLEPLLKDEDDTVRLAVKKALEPLK